MKTIDLILWLYGALYAALGVMVFVIAMDQGCLINCENAGFGEENPYTNPLVWIIFLALFWPIPLMLWKIVYRIIKSRS